MESTAFSHQPSSYFNETDMMNTKMTNLTQHQSVQGDSTSNNQSSTIPGDNTYNMSQIDTIPAESIPNQYNKDISNCAHFSQNTKPGSHFRGNAQSGNDVISKMMMSPEAVNFDLVQEALRRTSQTVSDLDDYLRDKIDLR